MKRLLDESGNPVTLLGFPVYLSEDENWPRGRIVLGSYDKISGWTTVVLDVPEELVGQDNGRNQ